MDTVTLIERSELWEMAFTFIALVFVLLKSTDVYKTFRSRIDQSRFALVAAAIEQAVNDTYETFVRDVRTKHADGKLTPQERKQARDMALRKARDYGKEIGVDLYDVFTSEFALRAEIQKVVDAKKTNKQAEGILIPLEEDTPKEEAE